MSQLNIDVTFTADELKSTDVTRSATVVVDILRASTTIVAAMSSGAAEVFAVSDPDRARHLAQRLEAVLGGEREGVPLEGFDLGNSPKHYVGANVRGKQIVLTTTNGTKTLQHCGDSEFVVVGCFNNLKAVVRALQEKSISSLTIACAGTSGGSEVAPEDVLFAGDLIRSLNSCDNFSLELEAGAIISEGYSSSVNKTLSEYLQQLPHAKQLSELGMGDDISWAAQRSVVDVVPRVRATNTEFVTVST